MPRQQLKKRADGTYRCKYHGKEFYGKTQGEALKKRQAYMDEEATGFDHASGTISFRDYAEKWVRVYRSTCCKSQQKQYINIVEFAAEVLENKRMMDITALDVQALFNTLTSRSPSYASKFKSTMKGIFTTAKAEGTIMHDPMVAISVPKTKKTVGHRALEQWERELIISTYKDHEFGLLAMVMMLSGLRRGEALYLDVDRDVDFNNMTITVRSAVSFSDGNQPTISLGKTEAAQRVIPLNELLAEALKDHHGLICSKEDGTLMSETSFRSKYNSYILHLETVLNGCQRRWYGKTKAHKALLAEGKELPPWKTVNIRCHDFRVEYCTQCYYAGVPLKILQNWMGHADATMILNVYTKLDKTHEVQEALKLGSYLKEAYCTPNEPQKAPENIVYIDFSAGFSTPVSPLQRRKKG